MESKKPLNKLHQEYSIEELLEASSKPSSESEIIEYKTDVLPFLSELDIRPGNNIISKRALYAIYKVWSLEPVTEHSFNKFCGNYLLSQGDRYYLVNVDPYIITQDSFKESIKKKQDKRKSPKWKKHFDAFLNHHSLEPGKIWVDSAALYFAYDKYCYNSKKKLHMGGRWFHGFCRVYFEERKKKGNTRTTWYAVNKSAKELISEEAYKSCKIEEKKYEEKEEDNKEKQS